jgi:hypothetical protein
MAKKSYLDSIDVPKPCDAAWDKMIGGDEKRFCLSCEKDVYNLSAMSRREARKLVANNAGKICVRYARLPNGKLYTTDKQLHQITRRTSIIAAGVIATTLSLSIASYAQGEAITHKQDSKQKEVAEQTKDKNTKNEIGTSQISFIAYDTTGARIPGAKAKLINEETNQEFLATTDNNYIIQFISLPKGGYKLEVSAANFQTNVRQIQITQAIEPTINIMLNVGKVEVMGDFTFIEYEIPFFNAIFQNDIKGVQTSIATGFDVNTKDKNNMTALHVAVEFENLEIAKLLLQNKADINAQDKDGKTPLMYAVDGITENFEAVKLFIKSGAKLETRDKEGNTALLIASDGYSKEIVEYLLKAGANPNVKNKESETPLSLAGNQEEIKEILRRYGAIK